MSRHHGDRHEEYGEMVEIDDLRHDYHSSMDSTQGGRNVTQFSRPMRPTQAHFDDYMGPDWSPGTPGKSGAHYLADTPGDSRSASPTLRSGQATPLDYLPPSRNLSSLDSRPSTPTVINPPSFHIGLLDTPLTTLPQAEPEPPQFNSVASTGVPTQQPQGLGTGFDSQVARP
jgi:hypothetical protein